MKSKKLSFIRYTLFYFYYIGPNLINLGDRPIDWEIIKALRDNID